MNELRIVPISFKDASEYVREHHRHHRPPVGWKFGIGLVDESSTLHGVAMCGRPVARALDDGLTCEVNRCCTDGTPNACSMLYGACCRIAKAMGYTRVVTYTLESESGTSLRASNFVCEGPAGAPQWTGRRYEGKAMPDNPPERKVRWSRYFER